MRTILTFTAAIFTSGFISGAAWSETITIDIKGFKYNADVVTLSVGDTIVFVNQDGAPHTATARDGSFDTGTLKKSKSGEVTVTAAGTFEYFCKFHKNMTGQITVN